MTSTRGKTKKWHTSRRRVCHWCFYPTFYLFYTMIRKGKRSIHIPAPYRLTVRRFVLDKAFLKSQTLLFVSTSSFFLYRTWTQFLRKVFQRLFLLKKQNILPNSESLVAMTHYGFFSEDFLHFRHSQVVKKLFLFKFLHFSSFEITPANLFTRLSMS